jgi:hypothetical protein
MKRKHNVERSRTTGEGRELRRFELLPPTKSDGESVLVVTLQKRTVDRQERKIAKPEVPLRILKGK